MKTKYNIGDLTMDDLFEIKTALNHEILNKRQQFDKLNKELLNLEDEYQHISYLLRQKENEELENDYDEYCKSTACFKGVF